MKNVHISDKDINQRLDKFLMKYLNKAGKSFIYKMLRKKRIKYNGKKANGNEILKIGDILQLYLSDETINSFKEQIFINKTSFDFSIIYEDENILICNKPVGLVSQPDIKNKENSLNNQILYYLYQKGEIDTSCNSTFIPSICNRLDRNTGGIVLFGKNFLSLQEINLAIRQNNISKFYITAVSGNIQKPGTLKAYHIKDKYNEAKVFDYFIPSSKEIITNYNPIKFKDGYTLLDVNIITGKSHQIRASFKHLGFPIIGDEKYGNTDINKIFKDKFNLNSQFLYAYKVGFNNMKGKLSYLNGKYFNAEIEKSMKKICSEFFSLSNLF